MTFKDYFNRYFTKDLTLLDHRPSGVMPNSPAVSGTPCIYAGRSWENWKRDFKLIEDGNHECFIISLFCTCALEVTVKKYFSTEYDNLKKRVALPRNEWVQGEMGVTPKSLLSIHTEQKRYMDKYIDSDRMKKLIDSGAMEIFYSSLERILKSFMPDIDTGSFISKMLADKSFKLDRADSGTPYENAYMKLKKNLSDRAGLQEA